MINYLLKSIVCSGLLLGVYFLFLEKEKMHRFNRFYLLSAFVVSWLIPLITFKISAPKIAEQIQTISFPATNTFIQIQSSETLMNTGIHQTPVDYMPLILSCIYGIITIILLIRFAMNMYHIRKQIVSHYVRKFEEYSLVIIPNNKVSFSFFNYIFPAQDDYVNGAMNQCIFLHESAHAKEKHSIDILFIELCKVFLWFNPFVFLYKKAIQLNHEFIADDVVVAQDKDVFDYQSLLLSKIMQLPVSQLVSSSNYSITKKRFIMMTKNTSRTKTLWLKLSIIPIAGIAIFGFSKKAEANPNEPATTHSAVSFISNDSDIVVQYNTLYKKLSVEGINQKGQKYSGYKGKRSDFIKLNNLYASMSDNEKQEVKQPLQSAFLKKLEIPNKKTPSQEQINKWGNSALYGVWIDGKRIDNQKLKDHAPADFKYYDVSNLSAAARKNDGFNVQIDLYTETGYKAMIRELENYNDDNHEINLIMTYPKVVKETKSSTPTTDNSRNSLQNGATNNN